MAIGSSMSGTPAPAASDAGATPVSLEKSLWSSFANARSDGALLTGWLAVLVNRVPDASLGVLLHPDPKAGAFVPAAVVPDPRRDLSPLREIAEKVMITGRPASRRSGDGDISYAAAPVRAGDAPPGYIVVLELRGSDGDAVQGALREIHWAAGWLASLLWRRGTEDTEARLKRAGVALDVLAVASEHRKPAAAAMAIVNEVQTALACDQVSIGLVQRRHRAPRIRLLSMSYSAWFRKRSTVAEGLETAMEECFDQNAAVSAPPLDSIARSVAVAHADLVRGTRTSHVLTVPLADADGPIGAMTCERRAADRPFAEADLLMAESIAALIGPVLELKQRNRRWIGGRLVDIGLHALGVLLGPRHLSWKLLGVTVLALLVAAATVRGPFRVQADAVLRAEELRAVSAPFAGFIAEAPVRAGDRVAAGDLLVRLDDADLRLEALRYRSEIDRLVSQAREAQAGYERAQVALLEAQIAQARAQLALANAELARTRLLAPIDGVVVSGDLSQQLGGPVQTGDVLFEVAPPDRYRIDLYVDERDLRYVSEGQTGRLTLAGQPTEGLALTTDRITPISEPREGANAFRVEAHLAQVPPGLRPGMEGVAKLDAGHELLVWVWTRRMIDWARQTLWTWQP